MANLPKIALDAWEWGNDGIFGNNLTADSLRPIFDVAMENGLNLWNTAHPMPEGSARAQTYNPVLDRLEILNAEFKKLADKYDVGVAQIPVAWAIARGTLPIIGVTKETQVEDAVKAVGVNLTTDEVSELEKTADSLELNVIRFWEKEMK